MFARREMERARLLRGLVSANGFRVGRWSAAVGQFSRSNSSGGAGGGGSVFGDRGDVDRVRDAADIVRIVGEVVSLKSKGREYVGLCPFHDDHTPSMCVVPSKQIFHCFVCQAGGDVFSFVRRFHKMEFREALEYLADRTGVTLTPRRAGAAEAAPTGPTRNDLLGAATTAQDFFRSILAHPEHGRAGRAIVEKRRISSEMAVQFGVGAAPDRWDGLLLYLKSKGLDPRVFIEAGLLKKRETDGGSYDAFRNRLMFPIQDRLGRVIAFGGRRINDEDEPKYINSPESRLFDKSGTLYALPLASRAIQESRTAIITEGYTDVIACHQGGFRNAVATLGTALTAKHATLLRGVCEKVLLLFDGDAAGQRAADRAASVFFSEPLDVAIVTLDKHTDAKDPDELLKREGGAEVFARALAGAVDLLEYRFARIRERLSGSGMAALSRAIDGEIEALIGLGLKDVPPVRQRLIIRRLSELAGVDEATLQRAIPAGRSSLRPGQGAVRAGDDSARNEDGSLPPIPKRLSAAAHLLGCVLCDGNLHAALEPDARRLIEPGRFEEVALRAVAEAVKVLAREGMAPSLNVLLSSTDDEGVRGAAVSLSSRLDLETDRDPERLAAHFRECLRRAKMDWSVSEGGAVEGADLGAAGVEEAGSEAGGAAAALPKSDTTAAMARLMEARNRHKTLGADRRQLPRG